MLYVVYDIKLSGDLNGGHKTFSHMHGDKIADKDLINYFEALRDRAYNKIDLLEKKGDTEEYIPSFERQIEKIYGTSHTYMTPYDYSNEPAAQLQTPHYDLDPVPAGMR